MISRLGRDEGTLLRWRGLRRRAEVPCVGCVDVVHRARNLRSGAQDGLIDRLVDWTLRLVAGSGCARLGRIVRALSLLRLLILGFIWLVLLSSGEETITCQRECTNDQKAHKPDHCSDKNRHNFEKSCRAHDLTALQVCVVGDGDRYTPPGKCGIEACRQQPSAEEIINLGGFVTSLLGSKNTGDTRKVNAAEGDGKDGGPAQTGKG